MTLHLMYTTYLSLKGLLVHFKIFIYPYLAFGYPGVIGYPDSEYNIVHNM